jgi:hypothetical protein
MVDIAFSLGSDVPIESRSDDPITGGLPAQAELGGHSYALHNPGSLFLTLVTPGGFVNLIWPLLMVSFGPTLKACDLSFRVGLGGRSP